MANAALVRAGLNQSRPVNLAAVTGPLATLWKGVVPRPSAPATGTPPDTTQFFM